MNGSLLSHLSEFYDIINNSLSFDLKNRHYFQTFDDYIGHIAKTLSELDIIRKEPKLAVPIVYNAIFDMDKDIGECFIEDLLLVLNKNDEYIFDIISGLQKDLINNKYSYQNKYYLDSEIVIFIYKLRSCITKGDKKEHISGQIGYYTSILVCNESLNRYEKQLLANRLKICKLYLRLIENYETSIESINVDLFDTRSISFVDIRYYPQVHRLLKNAPIQPYSKIKYVSQRYSDVLSAFLLNGSINKRKKIFFKSDPKTLTYCFSQLKKFNLLNRRGDQEGAYSDKELAKILFKSFSFGAPCSERTIYDYLRKGEMARPKYPVFIIEEFDSSETLDAYRNYYYFFQPSSNLMKKKIFGHKDDNEEPPY